jgi:hypothetical protein
MENKLQDFTAMGLPVRLCPVEDEDQTLYTRFCETCFDQTSPVLAIPAFARKRPSNPSISLAFADALRRAVVQVGANAFTPEVKRAVVKGAQARFEQMGLPRMLPTAFDPAAWTALTDAPQAYRTLLVAHGVAAPVADAAARQARLRCDEFLNQPRCTIRESSDLLDTALAHLRACTQSVPTA